LASIKFSMPLDISSMENSGSAILPPKKRGKFTCCLIILVPILIIILLAVWATLSTGLWRLPGISKIVYTPPVPERVVEPGASIESEVLKSLGQNFEQIIRTKSLNEPITLTLGERSLTQSLQTSLKNQTEISPFIDKNAQVAVAADGLHVFLPFVSANGEPANALEVTLLPEIVDGQIVVKAQNVSVGSLPIPDLAVDQLVDRFVTPQLEKINAEIARFGSVKSFSFAEGVMTVEVVATPPAF